jgi:hypothetical protein
MGSAAEVWRIFSALSEAASSPIRQRTPPGRGAVGPTAGGATTRSHHRNEISDGSEGFSPELSGP